MRFFHKFGSLNYDYIGLVNGILLSKKKKQYTNTFEYLKKYTSALKKEASVQPAESSNGRIWQCWLQGKNCMPQIVKVCTDSVKKYHPDKTILLDNKTIYEYITIPDYILEKYKKRIISDAHFSDICRLMLLAKYGGCWVDATIYLTGEIPDEIINAEFFTFRSYESNIFKNISSEKEFQIYNNYFNKAISPESSFFISAQKGNKIINNILNMILEYWKYEDKAINYLFFDQCFAWTLFSNPKLKKQFLDMPEYYIPNIMLLQNTLFEPYDEQLFKNICKQSNIHKLTHKNLHRNPYKNSFYKHIINL